MRLTALLVVLLGCGSDPSPGTSPLTSDQRRRADQLISVFENDTIEIQYAYIEDLDDGRGFTAGRAGFTTGTGDLLLVVETYTDAVPDNALVTFLPELRELADAESDDTSGLVGLPAAWEAAAEDAAFRDAQDAINDELYFDPAVDHWRDLGLTSPLALAELYDAITQHGDGEDPDGLPAMLDRTPEDEDETAWLTGFLAVRRATLEHAFDPETREEWAGSVDRVDAVQAILDDGNLELAGPIEIHTINHDAVIP